MTWIFHISGREVGKEVLIQAVGNWKGHLVNSATILLWVIEKTPGIGIGNS